MLEVIVEETLADDVSLGVNLLFRTSGRGSDESWCHSFLSLSQKQMFSQQCKTSAHKTCPCFA